MISRARASGWVGFVCAVAAIGALNASLFAANEPAAKDNPASSEIKLRPVEESTTTVTHESHEEDEMESMQSFNTYTSLEDGQPGQPGEFQINYFNGWETTSGESDPWLMTPQIEYNLGKLAPGCSFLKNTKIGLSVPMELGNGGVDGNGDLEVEWIQRWITETNCDWWPTFSTVNTLRVPSGYHSEKVDWTLTGVLAKNIGPGTAYVNAFLKSANGSNNLDSETSWAERVFPLRARVLKGVGLIDDEEEDLRNFQWGFRFGYKWRITECLGLVTDYVHQSSELRGDHNVNLGEVSLDWRVTDQLTIGPGILFGLDGAKETPNFGAGVCVHYEWE